MPNARPPRFVVLVVLAALVTALGLASCEARPGATAAADTAPAVTGFIPLGDPPALAGSAPQGAAPRAPSASASGAPAEAAKDLRGGGAGEADAAAGDGATGDAAAGDAATGDAVVIAPDNRIEPPRDSDELQARARALFEAIVANDPARAEPFWFPKAPFEPLKDVKDPGKYWENLHATYARDVKALHASRASWEGAVFRRFDLGSTPTWVPPGEEANQIGYYRSFRGKLRYAIDGREESFDVHTVISWQGRWYVTHLRRFKR